MFKIFQLLAVKFPLTIIAIRQELSARIRLISRKKDENRCKLSIFHFYPVADLYS